MPKHRLPVFDGDGHVYEDPDELVQYFEGAYAGIRRFRTFELFPSLDGWSRGINLAKAKDAESYRHAGTNAAVWGEMLGEIGAEGSVLYPTAGLACGLMQNAEVATALATAYNNWLEDRYTRLDPRLFGAGMVAVQNPVGAAKEIRRFKERKNFCAVYLPSVTALGRSYGDPFFWPIFEEAERQDLPLALHGGPSRGFGLDHLQPFLKVHTLEHPVPLMIQLTDMVFSGVFDIFPNLRVAFLEGGCAWVPFMLDRLDYEYHALFGAGVRKTLKKKPSDYLREGENFWVSLELGERSLKYVIDCIGADRIIYASDFPHEPSAEELVTSVPDFLAHPDYDDAVKAGVLGRNAKRLYRIG
jgi:predicted TIM-barrel fold metal-dependent hydrolase